MRSPHLLLVFLFASPVVQAAEYPDAEKTSATEPLAKAFSATKAARYLDAVAVNWTRDRQCITCHTNLPYLMARPRMPGDPAGWKEVHKFLEDDVARWQAGGKPRGDAYIVTTAAGLAFTDAARGQLSPSTRAAFDMMWKTQRPTGEWNWLKCNWPLIEHDDYYGAVLAAVAVAVAPEEYRKSEAAAAGLARLKGYFAKNPAPDRHHRAMLLWASTQIPGLMSAKEQAKCLAELKSAQRPDGGWSLPSLGTYLRRDKTPNDPDAASDGYATGLLLVVFRQAGVPANDPAVMRGIAWIKNHQRESGRWYTRSLNNDKAHYITNAATAMAVLALAEWGENVAVAPPSKE